jgi:catechol 2,3-dioxygenase
MLHYGTFMTSRSSPIAAGTRIGHVHLKVANIERSLAFYCGVLGFELQQRYGPQAAFISAGGYHHHIGLNTWQGEGAPPPPADALGLRYFKIELPNQTALDEVISRVDEAGIPANQNEKGLLLHDPSQNGVMLTKKS